MGVPASVTTTFSRSLVIYHPSALHVVLPSRHSHHWISSDIICYFFDKTMTIEVRRSSRRSILETKKDIKSVKTVPSPKKQVTKKVGKKAINKQNVVNLIETQKKLEPKKCDIKVYKLQEAKGDYKQTDIAVTEKLSKEEKQLLIPKKGAKTLVPLQAGVKKKRGRKPKNKGGKFQLKIRQNDDDAEPEDEDAHNEGNDLDRPDSGFSSRADT